VIIASQIAFVASSPRSSAGGGSTYADKKVNVVAIR
jgi:hypothetical protein